MITNDSSSHLLGIHVFPSTKRWDLFPFPLNLDWPFDLLWPIEYIKSDTVLNLGLRKLGSFYTCFLRVLSHHVMKSDYSTGEGGLGGWETVKRVMERDPDSLQTSPSPQVRCQCVNEATLCAWAHMILSSQHQLEQKKVVSSKPCPNCRIMSKLWLLH